MYRTAFQMFCSSNETASRLMLTAVFLTCWNGDVLPAGSLMAVTIPDAILIQADSSSTEDGTADQKPETANDKDPDGSGDSPTATPESDSAVTDNDNVPVPDPASEGAATPGPTNLIPRIQDAQKRPSFLMTGDAFSVQCVVSRTTRMQVGEGSETTRNVTDRMHFDYRVDAVSTAGEMTVNVAIHDCRREVRQKPKDGAGETENVIADHRIPQLQALEMSMQVSADGTVHNLRTSDRDQIVSKLTGGHSAALVFLSDSDLDEVIRNTIGRPFWMTSEFLRSQAVTSGGDSTNPPFPRSDHIALGPLGYLRVDVQGKQVSDKYVPPKSTDGSDAGSLPVPDNEVAATSTPTLPGTVIFDLTGTGNYVPPISERRLLSSLPVQLLSPEVKLEEYSGKALAWTDRQEKESAGTKDDESGTSPESAPAPEGLRPTIRPGSRQPPFFQLLLSHRFSGSAQMSIRNELTPVRFSQEQAQSWSLMKWRPVDAGFMNPLFRRRIR
jgi:hypothetical protein